jgi:predicted acyltransferase
MFTQWMKYKLYLPELYSNTLQAIAVGYLVTSLALLHLRLPGQIVLLAALLVGYWALLVFVPFGAYSAGTLERTANFARYVDEKVLDVFRRDHSFTWVVTSLGFSASVLLGAMAGHLLRARLPVSRRLLYLLLAGVGCMAGGWVWSYSHPLNRHLWTSSMVLWAGGWSFLLLALSHLVIDVWGVRRWAYPFIVIGANALLAYVLDPVIDWRLGKLLAWVFPTQLPTISADLLTATCELALLWLILWWLYRHRLFLRA